MAETENTQLVRDGYAALARGDVPAFLDMVADDFVLIIAGPAELPWRAPFAGSRPRQTGSLPWASNWTSRSLTSGPTLRRVTRSWLWCMRRRSCGAPAGGAWTMRPMS